MSLIVRALKTETSHLRPAELTGAWVDRLGAWASLGCILHCAATPILLSASAFAAHLLPSEENTHRVLAVGIAFVGGLALVRGMRLHKRLIVARCMLTGLVIIALTAFLGDHLPRHWMEIALTACGSSLLIAAHRMNHTFCRECRCVGASEMACGASPADHVQEEEACRI